MHFRHAKECRDDRALRYEGWHLGASILLFWTLSSLIPLYNKVVFNGLAGDVGFPYPITTAFLQLGFCAVVLTAYELLRYACCFHGAREPLPNSFSPAVLRQPSFDTSNVSSAVLSEEYLLEDGTAAAAQSACELDKDPFLGAGDRRPERGASAASQTAQGRESPDKLSRSSSESSPDSWLFGPNLWFKVRLAFPIGALFGFKYGVTNWGLHLLPLAPHLLLQATDLMWTVLFARVFAAETLTRLELVACAGSTLGTLLIAARTHQTAPDGLFSVLVNLTSPVLLGLCITSLRVATRRLLVTEAVIGGRTQNMTAFELSAIKLWISSLVILPFALVFENSGETLFGVRLPVHNPVPAYQFAAETSPALGFAALGGGFFVLVFQVNMTWLSKMASAVTVGMVGGMKVLPQWITAVAFSDKLDFSLFNIGGAALLLVSTMFWTFLRFDPSLTLVSPKYKVKMVPRARSASLLSRGSSSSPATVFGGNLTGPAADSPLVDSAREGPRRSQESSYGAIPVPHSTPSVANAP